MYYTSNPGNVGHQWFKRLFIDKQYKGAENPQDYVFIPAQVYDNKTLMDNNPEYVQALETLPEEMKRAHLYGDWDVFAGQYFTEFRREIHVLRPFEIPVDWLRYVALDYGLDMLAAYWIAVDHQGMAYIYRELYQPGLIISDAAQMINELTGMNKLNSTLRLQTCGIGGRIPGKARRRYLANMAFICPKPTMIGYRDGTSFMSG